ncbi:endoribonuclease MazF6 [Deinococcus xinjiangensis]|uniref:mRNA interferase n=1 Tax=Deinococcus xinjiangensis TaxID=457454 RepID=A0ABP9VA48_9DEIO
MSGFIQRGQIWWADLGEPRGSRPAYTRPVIVIQIDEINASLLNTVVVVALTSNLSAAAATGNVVLEPEQTGLPQASLVNVTQIQTINKSELLEYIGTLSLIDQRAIDAGLKLVLGLH